MKNIWGLIEMLYILDVLVDTWVYTFVKLYNLNVYSLLNVNRTPVKLVKIKLNKSSISSRYYGSSHSVTYPITLQNVFLCYRENIRVQRLETYKAHSPFFSLLSRVTYLLITNRYPHSRLYLGREFCRKKGREQIIHFSCEDQGKDNKLRELAISRLRQRLPRWPISAENCWKQPLNKPRVYISGVSTSNAQ